MKTRILRAVLLIGLLIGGLVSSVAPVQAVDGGSCHFYFISPGVVHVSYEYDLSGRAQVQQVDLLFDNQTVLSLSNRVQPRIYRRFEVGSGTHTCGIKVIVPEDPGYLAGQTAEVRNVFRGTPAFSESFTAGPDGPPLQIEYLRINPGISLAFTGFASDTSLRIELSTLDGSSINTDIEMRPESGLTFQECFFRRTVTVVGASPTFIGNEFYSTVDLVNRSEAVLTDNVFAGPLWFQNDPTRLTRHPLWTEESELNPLISGNNFVGSSSLVWDDYQTPLPPMRIPIGVNYYGDASGKLTTTERPNHGGLFLTNRYAKIANLSLDPVTGQLGMPFVLAGVSENELERTDKALLPRFWLAGSLVGQYSLSYTFAPASAPPLVRNIPTLLTFDLVTSDRRVTGVKAWLEVDGEQVLPLGGTPALYRDLNEVGASAVSRGATTINFVLPPSSEATQEVALYLDTTGLIEYEEAGRVSKIWQQTLNYRANFPRPLFITIAPIQVWMPFYNRAAPGTASSAAWLEQNLPAMLPLRRADFILHRVPTVRYISPTGLFTRVGLLNELATLNQGVTSMLNLMGSISGSPSRFDVAVVPLAAGNLGGDGASLPLRRQIIFVDEAKPSAIMHELGHAAGMYTGIANEQYQLHPPAGIELAGMTMFNPTEPPESRFAFKHFLLADYPYAARDYWFDVMGNSNAYSWVIPSTYQGFYEYLLGRLTLPTVAGRQVVEAGTPAPGMVRLAMYGPTEQFRYVCEPTNETYTRYRLLPEAITSFELGDLSDKTLPPLVPIPPDFMQPCGAPQQDRYQLIPYDADGPVFDYIQDFAVEPAGLGDQARDFWAATFDLPETVTRVRIRRQQDGTDVLDLRRGTAPFASQIIAPAPGTVLTETLTIRWEHTPLEEGQTVRHLVLFSTDEGVTWLPLPILAHGDELVLATESLPASEGIMFRTISSDGLRRAEDRVGGLVQANLAPEVRIIAPIAGDVSLPGQRWYLKAEAYDREDGLITSGVWSSSLQGELASSNGITEATLIPGEHRLTYSVTDTHGLTVSAAVEVEVTDTPQVNLAWREGDLEVSGFDPLMPQLRLSPGITNHLLLNVSNSGITVTTRVKVEVIPAGGTAFTLLDEMVTLEPFGVTRLALALRPEARAGYQIRASFNETVPADRDPADDVYTWNLAVRQTVFVPLLLR
ncbi:hypothetical protein EYB53_003090 [Candidatus Chloroploca sp. M-50]|uniref:Uncharacterized protein n=1 Tax=Candidatus Chloroploca mongolica TaxID=2528176 RepID=A0ABS4D5I5_9CHLR|nr:hypothetical protein [Candidatus Chloroploca mongolica]MBP1464688.1 hypothetical protein [Candidatus Chloroploca mongolica]